MIFQWVICIIVIPSAAAGGRRRRWRRRRRRHAPSAAIIAPGYHHRCCCDGGGDGSATAAPLSYLKNALGCPLTDGLSIVVHSRDAVGRRWAGWKGEGAQGWGGSTAHSWSNRRMEPKSQWNLGLAENDLFQKIHFNSFTNHLWIFPNPFPPPFVLIYKLLGYFGIFLGIWSEGGAGRGKECSY